VPNKSIPVTKNDLKSEKVALIPAMNSWQVKGKQVKGWKTFKKPNESKLDDMHELKVFTDEAGKVSLNAVNTSDSQKVVMVLGFLDFHN
jgi:hypothetical protein